MGSRGAGYASVGSTTEIVARLRRRMLVSRGPLPPADPHPEPGFCGLLGVVAWQTFGFAPVQWSRMFSFHVGSVDGDGAIAFLAWKWFVRERQSSGDDGALFRIIFPCSFHLSSEGLPVAVVELGLSRSVGEFISVSSLGSLTVFLQVPLTRVVALAHRIIS